MSADTEKIDLKPHYHLNQTLDSLTGVSKTLIKVKNEWAAVALNKFHNDSKVDYEFNIDGEEINCTLEWDSNFEPGGYKEKNDIAKEGAESLAFFVMSILLNYHYANQSEIGEGVDWGFQNNRPESDNFYIGCHYVEVSGIIEEKSSNKGTYRIKAKHTQIEKGTRKDEQTSVIVTIFKSPITIKEIHV